MILAEIGMLTLILVNIQGDQKFSVHLTITVKSSGAQRLFDHPVYLIHLLTAVGLTPSGSSTVHIYAQTIHRTQ